MQPAFKSKTKRSSFSRKVGAEPPVGIYELKFPESVKTKQVESEPQEHQVDLKYIHKSYTRRPTT